ncbi:MAG: DEAD/DEAH box helicase family protein, partial [Oscillospiraceae bacterium]
MASNNYASVAVSNTSYGYDRRYKYLIPFDMTERVFAGCRVLVPFGKGNKKRIGVVLNIVPWEELSDTDKEKAHLFKPIRSVIDKEPLLNAEMLDMLLWIRETTLCTYFEAFRTLIPIGLSVNFTQKYEAVTENIPDTAQLSHKAAKLWQDIQSDPESIYDAKNAEIKELLDKGFIMEKDDVKRRKKDDTVKMVRLTDDYFNSGAATLSDKQGKVAELLEDCGAASVKEITYICGVTNAVINAMKKKGIVETFDFEVVAEPNVSAEKSPDDIVLSDEQQACFDGIKGLIDSGKPDAALLYGVTGSGKTSVFIKLIQYVLRQGRTVIMLIPEISLTPQMVDKFQSLFGDQVSVMHSNLSLSRRLNEYKRVKNGAAKIVVGTRSAIYAPLENIGLIIMDEEGERT